MKWIKSASAGLLGSLVMFALMMIGIKVTGIAPFNMPPSAAFLKSMGLYAGPLALILHFGYGAFWSVLLLTICKARVGIKKGVLLASLLWLFMMIVYSPIIGWGFFGFGTASSLDPSAPLYLEAGAKYMIITLVLHLIYGTIIRWGNASWIDHKITSGQAED